MPHDPSGFLERLARHVAPPDEPDPTHRRSAVAVVMRRGDPGLELLLMRRVEHPEDPWSGQVSLPGGHVDPGDASLLHAAVRETREEVGVDLEQHARLLCRLAPVPAVGRGKVLPMDVTPFAFETTAAVDPRPGPEAAEVFWLPLARAAAGELDASYPYRRGDETLELPCWRFEERVVWGLTYRMVCGLLEVAAR
jgi:8-oxo-dGTP pyrophosphatase MutT (NUDIX family)